MLKKFQLFVTNGANVYFCEWLGVVSELNFVWKAFLENNFSISFVSYKRLVKHSYFCRPYLSLSNLRGCKKKKKGKIYCKARDH